MKTLPKIKPNFDIFYICEDGCHVLFKSVNEEFFMKIENHLLFEKLVHLLDGKNSTKGICKKIKIKTNILDIFISSLQSANILENDKLNFRGNFIEECYNDILYDFKKEGLGDVIKNKKITLLTFDKISSIFLKIFKKIGLNNISSIEVEKTDLNKLRNILQLLDKSDVVVCCLNFTFKELSLKVNDYCINNGIPVIFAQLDGIVGPTIISRKDSCFECFDSRVKESWWYKPFRFILTSKNFTYFNNSMPIIKCVLKNVIMETILTLSSSTRPRFKNKVLVINRDSEEFCKIIKRGACIHHGNEGGYKKFRIPKNVYIKLNDRKVVYTENDMRIAHPLKTIAKAKNIIGKFAVITKISKQSSPIKPFFYRSVTSDPLRDDLKRIVNHDRLLLMRQHSGKGVTPEQNKASSIMEAIERYSAKLQGDEQLIRGSYNRLKKYAINPKKFLISKIHFENYRDDLEIDWCWAYSLINKKPVLVPATFVFLVYFDPKTSRFLNYSSNGLASGNCIEEAILHGIYEVVERDAYMIMYQNKLCMPDINVDGVKKSGNKYINTLLKSIEDQGIKYFIKNITTDIHIPVIGTFLEKMENGKKLFSYAAGCHLNPNIALVRSLTEAVQLYPSTIGCEGIKIDDLKHLYQGGKEEIKINEIKNISSDNLKKDIETCIDIFKKLRFDIVVVNLTRPNIYFPVVRILIPGLQPEMVNLASPVISKRLFDVPKKLGYMKNKPKHFLLSRIPGYSDLYERVRFSI